MGLYTQNRVAQYIACYLLLQYWLLLESQKENLLSDKKQVLWVSKYLMMMQMSSFLSTMQSLFITII